MTLFSFTHRLASLYMRSASAFPVGISPTTVVKAPVPNLAPFTSWILLLLRFLRWGGAANASTHGRKCVRYMCIG